MLRVLVLKNAANFLKDYAIYVYVTEDGLVSTQIDKGQKIKKLCSQQPHSVSA